MPLRKRAIIGLIGGALAAGCSRPAGGPAPSSPAGPRTAASSPSSPTSLSAPKAPGERLFYLTEAGLSAVDTAKGQIEFSVPGATALTAAPDWSRFVTCTPDGGRTRVQLFDANGGTVRGAATLDGGLTTRAVSPRGRRVALLAADAPGAYPWTPAGRAHTTLVVADPSGESAPTTYELEGNYAPEAFGAGQQQLFVIQHLPPLAPDRYRVRQLDLRLGTAGAILSRNKKLVAAEEEMRGQGRMQVYAPSLTTLYTLYTKQDDHLHTRDMVAAGGSGRPTLDAHAFVHVLSLSEGWAYCLDLPAPFGLGPTQAHTLTVSPDGHRLYVADCSSGWLATADTTGLQVHQAGQFVPEGHHTGHEASLQAGPKGKLYVAIGPEILTVDGRTLKAEQRWGLDDVVHSLALSLDGQRLYAALRDRIAVLDATSGQGLSSMAAPGITAIPRVLPHPGT